MTDGPRSLPPEVDMTTPSAARLYDFYLGGKDNFPADRQAGNDLLARIPEVRTMAQANRLWLRRVVRYLVAEAGVRQFIDIGSGLPTADNTHEIAHRHDPQARVVYVDHDPIVLAHARALLAEDPVTTDVVQADLREPHTILRAPQTQRLIDPEQPVAILLVAVLHFLRDQDGPHEILAQLREELAPGSFLAVSHVENDTMPERAELLEQLYAATSSPGQTRGYAEIAGFFEGFELVDPGLCHVSDWRPDPDEPYYPPEQAWGYGGLGRLAR
ncbi:SAM-dependent methyltransferase [Salinactinospora qingdaonensis]|uniref:SAM-dependent methyltransferase n=1 Tax=Salinactinospora qingdaonensis TaxID=702744 RepID=A0ABP7FU55_9ACTN